MSERRAWSLLTIEGPRQYGGNTGYRDDPASVYRYDSDVANHLQVQARDIVIVRTRIRAIGVAEVARIEQSTGLKDRLRCPQCRATNIKRRVSKLPPWSCKSGHAFDKPLREPVEVTTYAAHYGETFVPCGEELTAARLNDAVIRPSDQMSIKEVDLARLEPFLGTSPAVDALVRGFAGQIGIPDKADPDGGDEAATIIDRRRRIMREIALRRGQARFRARLIRRYGAACQISRCDFPGLVEAAHISPYSASEDNGAKNGLLLRTDLHTLFDLGLLGIEPETLLIRLNPLLHMAGYADFEGAALFINGASGPGTDPLQERWDFFLTKLETGSESLSLPSRTPSAVRPSR